MIKRLNCTGKRYYIFMVLTIAVAIFYVALMCNKTMPFAEGWYTYYAQLINEKGLLPYKDFEYLFRRSTFILLRLSRAFSDMIF